MLRKLLTSAAIAISVSSSAGSEVSAQSYPIDCAIILCLSGGWPASVECTRAKAEFIRRITPYPVEPPVQVWNCPMKSSYLHQQQSVPLDWLMWASTQQADQRATTIADQIIRVQQADIDLSGEDFDFIRSVLVWEINFRQSVNKDGECREFDNSRLGSYGAQGNYAWTPTSLSVTPARFGLRVPICNGNSAQSVRAVVVEWESYEGTPGFEVVHY